MRSRRVVLLLTAAVLSIMLGVYLYGNAQMPAELHAAQAQEKTINNSLSVQGTLEPARESRIAPSSPAVVRQTFVGQGDTVLAGDPLLELTPASWLDGDLSRVAAAYLGQPFTANTQDGAILYADMDGTVTALAEAGALLYPAQAAVTLADLTAVQIAVEVPEIYASSLALGQTAQATAVTDGETVYTGRLTQIAGTIQEQANLLSQTSSRSVACVLSLDETGAALLPGATMDVTIRTDSVARAVTVPYAAVRQDGDGEYIYIATADGIEQRPIETGYQLSADIQVKSGVAAGEWVLVDAELPDDWTGEYRVVSA